MIKKLLSRLGQKVASSSQRAGFKQWPLHVMALTMYTLTAQAQTAIETNQAGANARIEVLGSLFTPTPPTATTPTAARAPGPALLPGADVRAAVLVRAACAC